MKRVLMAVIRILNYLKRPQLWRYVGFMCSVIGVVCYALSSSFKHLFGEWNLLKISLYGVGSFTVFTFMFFAKKWKLSCSLILKAHVGFLVLMVTSVYSFFYDKAVKGKTDVFGLISCGAFAFMSFSLSRQIELGFEVDLLNFFLGCLTVQLMKINLMLASVGAVFCYFLILLRSSLDSQPQQQQIGMVRITDHVAVQFDAENGLEGASESDRGNNIVCIPGGISHQQKISSLRRRKTAQKLKIKIPDNFFTSTLEDDGHSWRKYAQKEILDCEFPRSYYRCTGKYDQGCQALKQVQQIQENPDMFHIAYIGLHTCKDTLNAPHLVIDSFNREPFLMNSHPDSKVPNEQDHSISSSNSSSTIKQEYPKGDTPSDLINHKLDPSQWSDLKDSEVRAIMIIMECDNADTVYSCTSTQNLGVDFGKDEASTHNSSNNEDKGC